MSIGIAGGGLSGLSFALKGQGSYCRSKRYTVQIIPYLLNGMFASKQKRWNEMNPKKASRITSKPIRIYERDTKLGGWIQTVRTDSGKGSIIAGYHILTL